jgi:hypothetical protein
MIDTQIILDVNAARQWFNYLGQVAARCSDHID